MRKKLIGRISMDFILELCFQTQGERNNQKPLILLGARQVGKT
nr:hypothetical protein [uncultured Prevotella sp.]